jgi:hypothetical protein
MIQCCHPRQEREKREEEQSERERERERVRERGEGERREGGREGENVWIAAALNATGTGVSLANFQCFPPA